jgi:2-keto-3-deoxy-L-rhamnonate aldolase RhmA
MHVVEVVAATRAKTGVDAVVLDAEHAPFDLQQLDAVLAIGAALDVPCLVRVAHLARVEIQRALDLGAVGVVVPHVMSAEAARSAVRWSHYGPGGRGFSGSTRSARWGTSSMDDVLAAASEMTTVVVQIEDPEALGELAAIVTTPGVDAVFVGEADLTVGLGCRAPSDPAARAAVDQIVAAARSASMPVVAIAPSPAAVETWRARGVALVIHGTDQTRLHDDGWRNEPA